MRHQHEETGVEPSLTLQLRGIHHVYMKVPFSITNVNTYSKSFDILSDEPELYSVSDLKKRYRRREDAELNVFARVDKGLREIFKL